MKNDILWNDEIQTLIENEIGTLVNVKMDGEVSIEEIGLGEEKCKRRFYVTTVNGEYTVLINHINGVYKNHQICKGFDAIAKEYDRW